MASTPRPATKSSCSNSHRNWSSTASFVSALGERVARLSSVRHASYVHVRRLDRPSADRLQLVSDLTQGWRLSEMLAGIRGRQHSDRHHRRHRAAAPAAAGRGVVWPAQSRRGDRHHLAASPDRDPQSRLVIAEHAFGPAIEKLNLGRDKLWRDYRIAMPPSAGLPRANQRADAMAVGVVALTLLIGRSLETDEFPGQLQSLVDGAQESRDGQGSALSSAFSNWLKRALQFDVTNAFQTPSEAQVAFESVLASDRSYVTTSPTFIEWVSRIGITIENKRPPKPAKAAPPPPPAPARGRASARVRPRDGPEENLAGRVVRREVRADQSPLESVSLARPCRRRTCWLDRPASRCNEWWSPSLSLTQRRCPNPWKLSNPNPSLLKRSTFSSRSTPRGC